MYYVNNYCVPVMYVCCTLCFRCVRTVRVMCLVTHDTNTCDMVICEGNNYGRACTEVRRTD